MNAKRMSDLPDLEAFLTNRRDFPPERLRTFSGQYIAWNLEGTAIVASAPDEPALHDKLVELGIDPGQVVGS